MDVNIAHTMCVRLVDNRIGLATWLVQKKIGKERKSRPKVFSVWMGFVCR